MPHDVDLSIDVELPASATHPQHTGELPGADLLDREPSADAEPAV
jgi:hypothetical protein